MRRAEGEVFSAGRRKARNSEVGDAVRCDSMMGAERTGNHRANTAQASGYEMLSRPRPEPQGHRARLAGVGMGQKVVASNIMRNHIPLFCRVAV